VEDCDRLRHSLTRHDSPMRGRALKLWQRIQRALGRVVLYV
jgi:hypothetical protein